MALALLELFAGACSGAESLAPEPADCPEDAACLVALPERGVGSDFSGATGSVAASGAGACGQLTFQSTCAACMDQLCCSEDEKCAENTDCFALATCASVCAVGETECVTSCSSENSAGAALYNAVTQCLQTSCAAECNATAGTGCGNLVFQRSTCPACINQACCSQATACSKNTDCVTIQQCAGLCLPTDTDCLNACSNLGPDGVAAFTALEQCINTSCGTVCP